MKTIGLFLGTTEDSYGKEVVRGVVEGLRGSGNRLICFTSGTIHSRHGYEAQRNVLYDLVDSRSVDGLIVSGSLSHNVSHDELVEFCRGYQPIPLVTMSVSLPGVPSVVTDNRAGMAEVVDHLIADHGYTRLAFVAGPPGQQESELRKAVFVDRLAAAGLELRPEWLVHGDFTRESGMDAARELLRVLEGAGEPFQGIVSANDSMALGLQEVLTAAGWRIPQDLFVTGFDDMPESRLYQPPLTTVRQSSSHLAEETTRTLLRLLDGQAVPEVTARPPTLMIRASCGCVGQTQGLTKEDYLLTGDSGRAWKERLVAAFDQAGRTGEGERFLADVRAFLANENQIEPETFARSLLNRLSQRATPAQRPMLNEARSLVAEAALRWEGRERALTTELLDRLRNTTEDMLTSESFGKLLDILQSNLVHMGFPGFWLSLFEDPAQPAKASRLHVAHDPEGHAFTSADGRSFPSRELIPGGLGQLDARYNLLVVEALYSRNARLGFILFACDVNGTQITGTLRGQLSGALQAVLLLEERKQAEMQLIQSEKMAALGALVAGVAHEINTPLGVAITASSFLAVKSAEFLEKFRSGKATRSEFEAFLTDTVQVGQSVEVNLMRAADLISSFKQVSADQASEQRRQFALKEYLADALVSLHFQWKNRNVEVKLEGDDNQKLDSYPGAFVQIVTNLLSNSLLHAFDKDTPGTITLTVENRGASVQLVYADDGVGIPPDHVGRIFEPFFTTKRGRGGTGLGLNIVFNLVTNLLGGVITCTSAPGQGTRFQLLLPRKSP